MKKQFLALLLMSFSFATMAQTEAEKKTCYPEISVTGKLGFARLKQSGYESMNGNIYVPLNGNMNGSDILLFFPIGSKLKIGSGLGYYEFNANMTISGNDASLKNTYLRIPLQFSGDFNICKSQKTGNENIFFTINLGLYANTVLKQELETMTGNNNSKNLGWNFGMSSQAGAKFILSDALNVGIGLESQSDFTKAKKNGGEQKIEQFNGMYFKIGLTF